MRIAYVDCASNVVDAFEAFAHKAEEKQSNTYVQRITAPDLLKIPVCTKKTLVGNDVAVVFLTIDKDDWQAMALVHEKMVDVELAAEKYVFFCIISSEEYRDNQGLEQLIEKRYDTLLDLIVKMFHSPGEVSQVIGNQEQSEAISQLGGAMSMFSSPAEPAAPATDAGNPLDSLPSAPIENEEDDVKSLF